MFVTITELSALNSPEEGPEAAEKDEYDDDAVLHASKHTDADPKLVAPRWPTRVFAIESLLKIIAACEVDAAHFDLHQAKQLKLAGKGKSKLLKIKQVGYVRFHPFFVT